VIVLDTNVISELVRREPSPIVLRNLRGLSSRDLYTTAISEAEIRFGLAILPRGRKHTALRNQLDLILKQEFAGRILPFDSTAAAAYAELVARRRATGQPISVFDGQIAAIALIHGATLATRNVRDFQGLQFPLIDPWAET
jgi:predicted nucleic acid-binding protein